MKLIRKTDRGETGSVLVSGSRIPWKQILGLAGLIAAILIFTSIFYKQSFVGLHTANSMDIAQIARNFSEGQGFTTRLIRPFNTVFYDGDTGLLPEMNHAPVFPLAVASIFKLRNPSDQTIVWASMLFFLLTIAATYVLGRLIFDWRTGLLAISIFTVSFFVQKTAISGEEWTLCALLFTLLLCSIAAHHRSLMKTQRPLVGMMYPAVSALLIALLYMTHHVLVFLALPTAIYYAVTGQSKRIHLIVFSGLSVLLIAPWAVRNMMLTGNPILGITGWDIMSHTKAFPGDTIYRTVDAGNSSIGKLLLFPIQHFPSFAGKLVSGSSEIGGAFFGVLGWLAASFAIVSMMYRFKSASANAVRGFIYGALPLMISVFALFSVDSKVVVMFAPVVAVLSASYFILLLDAKKLHPFFVKCLIGGLLFLTALPSISAMLWPTPLSLPSGTAQAYQLFTNSSFNQQILTTPVYTDIPWAIAWKTQGVGVWLPKTDSDITELTIKSLPMNILVLTPEIDNYTRDEIWYNLYNVRLWREFIRDPKEGPKQILLDAGLSPENMKHAERVLSRLLRRYPISDSLKGFVNIPMDPLEPNELQVLVRNEETR